MDTFGYFKVLFGTFWYFEVLLGTLRYFGYFEVQNVYFRKVIFYNFGKTIFLAMSDEQIISDFTQTVKIAHIALIFCQNTKNFMSSKITC